ncbi:MAG: flagellar hook-length control protein FliK [Lachnospiraceae bacterium]|nr:flagellar hook-length control protein FliK [Lachnospiraceae bacterium]
MESVLSGYSQNYGGTQIGQGQGYTGTVGTTGNAASGNAQGVDVTQLQPGDTFQGEIVSVNGEDVQIQLANGQYMAKLERDVQLALGQVMNLQVQSNKDNRVVLKPVYDGKMQMVRVGEAALRAAHMAVNDRTMALVSTLLENGMSINKNTLMLFNRLTLQNPGASMADLIKLTKLQLPVNDNTLSQLQHYENMEHKLLDGINEASDEILKLYDVLTGKADVQSVLSGQTALVNGGKFMEQVLVLLTGEEGQTGGTQGTANGTANPDTAVVPENQSTQDAQNSQNVQSNTENINQNTVMIQAEHSAENLAGKYMESDAGMKETAQESAEKAGAQTLKQEEAAGTAANKTLDVFLDQLKEETPQAIPGKIISMIRDGIREGTLGLKDVKQLLLDSEIGRQLTTEQKAEIFRSEPFKSILKNGLQKQWTLSPQELAQEGKVEEFYQKLARESSQLTRMMNDAVQANGQSSTGTPARAMANLSENVEFMNQMNQMFTYVQLPLRFGNSQAHGDLYVYTNKKNMARQDGMLTAFLHLDMDHLGALDVSISLQTQRNQVTTKFYLDETSIALVEGHIDELSQRLSKKGYQCKNMILEKDEDKTVLERMGEQVAGGSAVLGYRIFDTRA